MSLCPWVNAWNPELIISYCDHKEDTVCGGNPQNIQIHNYDDSSSFSLAILLAHSLNHHIRIIRLSLCADKVCRELESQNMSQTVVLPSVFTLLQKPSDCCFFFISLDGSIFTDVLEAGPVTVLKCSGNGRKHASLPFIQSGIFTEVFFFCPQHFICFDWATSWRGPILFTHPRFMASPSKGSSWVINHTDSSPDPGVGLETWSGAQ